ncbi:unnamed protein product, partial [Sphagnum balticum]
KVYLDKRSRLAGVDEALRFSEKWMCYYCKKQGAGFSCHMKKCYLSAHYECARVSGWLFDWASYKAYCKKCAYLPEDESQ